VNLTYTREARDRIRSLPPEIKREIKQAMEALGEDPYLGKPLRRELTGFWSFRVRNFWILYRQSADEKNLIIVTLGRRELIYDDLLKTS